MNIISRIIIYILNTGFILLNMKLLIMNIKKKYRSWIKERYKKNKKRVR